jgi:hypothetical protein
VYALKVGKLWQLSLASLANVLRRIRIRIRIKLWERNEFKCWEVD